MLNIVPGKFSGPRLGFRVLARPRLYEKLERGLVRDLTLVIPPAGFGKTVLLRSWMGLGTRPIAWMSLDPNDNQLVEALMGATGEMAETLKSLSAAGVLIELVDEDTGRIVITTSFATSCKKGWLPNTRRARLRIYIVT